ncbi:MAG: thiamine pyrophosphate-dependent enzyme, partial [Candidatus Bathyarchaeia archaeon]
LAELLAIPVSGALGKLGYMNFPTNHPLSASIPVEEADVVLVIEDHSPWKGECIPNPQAKYINLAVDPLYAHLYSITSHCPADIFITADPATALAHLYSIAHRLVSDDKAKQREIGERFEQIKKIHIKEVEAKKEEAIAFKDKKPIERSWINYCIGQVKGETDILINDYGYTFQGTGDFIIPGTFFSTPPSACLGWGLGAALGAKLAAPENTIIACMGDGGYIYGNPLAAHFTSRKYNLPFLTVIYNNQGWGDPHKALLKEYPNGWAVKYGYLGTFNSLSPSLDFELICKSANGYAETVEDPHEVRPALERALTAVKKEKRQALLNFIINPIG